APGPFPANPPTMCHIKGTMYVRSMIFGLLFGNVGSTVGTESWAGETTQPINKTFQGGVFPMGISLNPADNFGANPNILSVPVGGTFHWQISTNAEWTDITAFNASAVGGAIDYYIKTSTTGATPPTTLGGGAACTNGQQAVNQSKLAGI